MQLYSSLPWSLVHEEQVKLYSSLPWSLVYEEQVKLYIKPGTEVNVLENWLNFLLPGLILNHWLALNLWFKIRTGGRLLSYLAQIETKSVLQYYYIYFMIIDQYLCFALELKGNCSNLSKSFRKKKSVTNYSIAIKFKKDNFFSILWIPLCWFNHVTKDETSETSVRIFSVPSFSWSPPPNYKKVFFFISFFKTWNRNFFKVDIGIVISLKLNLES